MKLKNWITLSFIALAPFQSFALEIGQIPPKVMLDGETGGKVSGGAWDSSSLKDKISVIFHVAPAEKDLNKAATDALKDAQLDRSKYQSYAIVNMAASNWPNFVIASKLKASQEEFPHTIYVKDIKKALVTQWKVADHSNSVIVLGKDEKVLFHHDGKLEQSKIDEMMEIIRKNI